MTDGLLVVDKPAGITSHDVVSRVRRLAGTRRVGHAGTLDPMATGVLLVGIDRATRLLGHLAGHDKDYEATIRLGVTTTSDDAEGEVLATVEASGVSDEALATAMAAQRGDLEQVPSSVSAVKVDGKRAYARVRAGEQVELTPRPVHVERFELVRRDGDTVDVAVTCSTGTYVRALARDVGASLGVGAHLTALRRTRVGGFDVGQARSLDELADTVSDGGALPVLALGELLRASFSTLMVDEVEAHRLALGQRLVLDLPGDGPVGVLDPDGSAVALVLRRADGSAQPTVVLRAP